MRCHMKGCPKFGKEDACVHALMRVPPPADTYRRVQETEDQYNADDAAAKRGHIDLDNPPEEAKPYVALYELRMNDVRKLEAENKDLREKLRISEEVRLAAVRAHADLFDKVQAFIDTMKPKGGS